jgi:hypothetical protein
LSTGLYTTNDAWETVNAAVGKSYMVNPETGETEVVFGVQADALVGDLIIGQKLGIYSEDKSAQMSFDSDGLVLNTVDDGSGIYKKIFAIQKDGVDQLYIDSDGNLVIANDQIIETTDSITSLTNNVVNLSNKTKALRDDVDDMTLDIDNLQTSSSDLSAAVDNIITVLSGTPGEEPLQKVYLNKNNAVISTDLFSTLEDGTLATVASQIIYMDGSTETNVQAELDEHNTSINNLNNQITISQNRYFELLEMINNIQFDENLITVEDIDNICKT